MWITRWLYPMLIYQYITSKHKSPIYQLANLSMLNQTLGPSTMWIASGTAQAVSCPLISLHQCWMFLQKFLVAGDWNHGEMYGIMKVNDG